MIGRKFSLIIHRCFASQLRLMLFHQLYPTMQNQEQKYDQMRTETPMLHPLEGRPVTMASQTPSNSSNLARDSGRVARDGEDASQHAALRPHELLREPPPVACPEVLHSASPNFERVFSLTPSGKPYTQLAGEYTNRRLYSHLAANRM